MKATFISPQEAVSYIKNESTVALVGMTLVGASEAIYKAVEGSFFKNGYPNNLTIVHSAGQSNRKDGIQHFAHEGLLKRIIGSHWGLQPRTMQLIHENKIEAYCIPQGQIAHLYRAMSHGNPGRITKIGLNTFVDPRLEGGKMNERTKALPDISEVITIKDEEFMFYHEIPLDVVIFRGTTADENGNITTEDEPMKLEILPAVLAAKRFGGKVIAQVRRVAQNGTLHAKDVVVPGVFVDAIVVAQSNEDHPQTNCTLYDPVYSGDLKVPTDAIQPIPFNIRKVIGRRGVMLLKSGSIINLGTGIPNDTVGPVLFEEQLSDQIMVTVESGLYGGIPEGGIDFGIGKNVEAFITHQEQFDFYNGAGVDFTFMGVGEIDQYGNVNSTKFGSRAPGAGGFIDITQGAKNCVFLTTFTAQGLEVEFNEKGVQIKQEGKTKKFVNKIQQMSYNAECRTKGQNAYYVTERAVFKLVKDGIELIEIAPGVNLEADILANMEFRPKISPHLKEMDPRIFLDKPMKLSL
ncbi:MAG TPA: acyl CoA:acetate/3-ketoacid CoA transferase [Firmicutes bacterium]|nr:acyl CoA:acetate/3-ketoacid CoA transferase [Bacillota bacterium]HBK69798.1 acyl CoA:acetate/3-ketoacid CoA transferase [Bacillota bacterium]HBT18126.1 acyl CoA:acetate/3-ketoacid CoA transferase [Bacillota bacterium]